MKKSLTHGSLFSGIGGFDLAAEWMGWENIFHCEWNEFGQKILKHYWPNAATYEDITKTDFNIYRGRIDILSGGFPCQPYSAAGKRLGKEDDRHLWPEMLRAIREIQPTYVVAENVFGLTTWNDGMVFNEVQVDLEAQGYEVQTYVLPACSVGAPHRRDRVWFVSRLISNARSDGQHGNQESKKGFINKRGGMSLDEPDTLCTSRIITDPKSSSSKGKLQQGQREGQPGGRDSKRASSNTNSERGRDKNDRKRQGTAFSLTDSQANTWENFPTQSPICTGDDGLSSQLDGITFPKWRSESIKAAGNAIVPQVAHQIFKTIGLIEK